MATEVKEIAAYRVFYLLQKSRTERQKNNKPPLWSQEGMWVPKLPDLLISLTLAVP